MFYWLTKKRISLYIALSTAFLLTMYNYYSKVDDDNPYLNGEQYFNSENTKNIDRLCSTLFTNVCYSVVDRISEDGFVDRFIILNDDFRFLETSVKLIKPDGHDFWTSDTTLWKINHNHIDGDYIIMLATIPFAMNIMSQSPNTKGNILEIGLGGGSLSMFLHTKYRNFNITVSEIEEQMIIIARKYFDIQYNSHNYHIKYEDGIKTIEDSVLSNTLYDVIILDACEASEPIPCPVEAFTKDDILDKIKQILKPTGIFSVNLLITNENSSYHFKNFLEKLFKRFPVCMYGHSDDELNTVIGCVKYSINNLEESQSIFQNTYEKLIDEWQLPEYMKDIKFKLLNKSGLKTIY
ncbi:Methyltransferase-like protein 13 [Strongyloides ratti]|uniref:Methyltransferase-like protein 13 n=1 Tax=Strongyloides ratti TaxID=34506 RepID=A0A090L0R0_STRRB|nr:Methyltransferase-like protein 13 [Strongyloides ratti]CEF63251.1 Methyltransferase-like protein 13 [Strongyloides ratti]